MSMGSSASEMGARVIRITAPPGNATPVLRAAFAKARWQHGMPVTIQLAPGRYRCAGAGQAPIFALDDLANVTLDGDGATIVGASLARLFVFRNGRGLTVRNLTVAWEPLPYTAGRVVRLLPDLHAFEMAPLVPADPVPGRTVQAILAYDPARGRLAENGWEVYQTQGECDNVPMTRTADGLLRVAVTRGGRLPEVGWSVIARHQVYGDDAFVFSGCRDVLMEDVTVRAVPGMAVIGWGSRDITIRRLRVVPVEGGWMSATADAMHFGACRGQVVVEDSIFAGMGDDAINIHGMYGLVMDRPDDRTLVVARARLHPYYDTARTIWDAPEAGDVLEYGVGDQPLLAQGQLTVASARQDVLQQRTVIHTTTPLPASVGSSTLLANLSATPAVRIRRCQVRGNRARGFLLQTRDVVVEDCDFTDVSAAGIQICTDAAEWWESLGARDVTVQRCTFRRCNFGVARRAAALDIFADLPHWTAAAAGVHQRLHLLNNTFVDNAGVDLQLGSAADVEVRGNTGTPRFTVIVTNSRGITFTSNTNLTLTNHGTPAEELHLVP
jgi:hypothetical protein